DLARRDFTINAMALRLSEPAGSLLDRFGGRLDLEAGLVRVLHPGSFRDDATRMVRACRYAARFGFEIEASTLAALQREVRYVETISGARLRAELTRALVEPAAPDTAVMMNDLRVLRSIHPVLYIPMRKSRRAAMEAWRQLLSGRSAVDPEELGFCMIAGPHSHDDAAAVAERLSLTTRVRDAVDDLVRLDEVRDKLERRDARPSQVVRILEGLAPSAVLAFGLKSGAWLSTVAARYVTEWRTVRPSLDGHDLAALGIEGVLAGEALRRLRQARLDGEVGSRQEETDLVRQEFGANGT
ncbi:MAG TPA: hypothetical protein VH951_13150, partial [Dehalococcoidia bacterium]